MEGACQNGGGGTKRKGRSSHGRNLVGRKGGAEAEGRRVGNGEATELSRLGALPSGRAGRRRRGREREIGEGRSGGKGRDVCRGVGNGE